MLRINNNLVLNIFDLDECFSAWEIFEQRDKFQKFAAVHCVPLPLMLSDKDGKPRRAIFLDKAFWMKVLNEPEKICGDQWRWPENQNEQKNILEAAIKRVETDTGDSLLPEVEDAQILEKLNFIIKEAKFGNSNKDGVKAWTLLAICELAEQDALSQYFRRHDDSDEKNVNEMPHADLVPLKARKEPYRYYFYEGDTLPNGEIIKTVRVSAVPGDKGENKVLIELYRPESMECIHKLTLERGQYRDCNVAMGRIIKFLPTMAVSDNLCLMRKDLAKDTITVRSAGAEEWVLELDDELSKKITCMSVGDEKNTGFLLLEDGKIIKSFYKPSSRSQVRLALSMCTEHIVELQVLQEGYCLLTECGDIISNIQAYDDLKGRVSLDLNARKPLLRVEKKAGVQECVVSTSERSAAIRQNGDCEVFFADEGKPVRLKNGSLLLTNT